MFFKNKRKQDDALLEIFRSYSQQLSSIASLGDLLKNVLATVTSVAQVKTGHILLYDERLSAFVVRQSAGPDPLTIQFSSSDPFVTFLRRTSYPTTKHELVKDRSFIDIKEVGVRLMTSLNAEVVFPMAIEGKFMGIFALGASSDYQAYAHKTLDLLYILIRMASISIDNAVLYDAMNKQNLKLSEIAKLKTDFVNTISHELRTPLNGILGLTQAVLDEGGTGELNDNQRRYIQMIQRAGDELLGIVNQILELTHFSSQSNVLEVKKVDLAKALQKTAQGIDDLLRMKHFRLEVDLGSLVSVYGDEGQIRQVLQCLIENAMKFSKEGKAHHKIGVRASKNGDMLQICVYDDGIGIDDEDQELIFEDFRQADGDFNREYGGAGLGLAIAKKIIEMHGGRIWVESKKGEGSEFYFTLPLKPSFVQATELN